MAIVVTAGQRNDGTQLEPVLDAIHVPQRRSPAIKRPKRVRLDRAYGARRYGPARADRARGGSGAPI
jgi:hypothetical protein